MTDVQARLFALQDSKYRCFSAKLIPNIPFERIIGVRISDIRHLAKTILKESPRKVGKFVSSLPHYYLEENNLHAYIVAMEKDFDKCLGMVEEFLPHIDNWSTCDTFNPGVFATNREKLLPHVRLWLSSDKPYIIRFALCCLMNYFLDDENFSPEYLEEVSRVRCEDYYVMMGVAWFFATALSKQWEATLPYIKERRLDVLTHNKIISKTVESFRISPEHKREMKRHRIVDGKQACAIMETNC